MRRHPAESHKDLPLNIRCLPPDYPTTTFDSPPTPNLDEMPKDYEAAHCPDKVFSGFVDAVTSAFKRLSLKKRPDLNVPKENNFWFPDQLFLEPNQSAQDPRFRYVFKAPHDEAYDPPSLTNHSIWDGTTTSNKLRKQPSRLPVDSSRPALRDQSHITCIQVQQSTRQRNPPHGGRLQNANIVTSSGDDGEQSMLQKILWEQFDLRYAEDLLAQFMDERPEDESQEDAQLRTWKANIDESSNPGSPESDSSSDDESDIPTWPEDVSKLRDGDAWEPSFGGQPSKMDISYILASSPPEAASNPGASSERTYTCRQCPEIFDKQYLLK
jgi:hypothetical protein